MEKELLFAASKLIKEKPSLKEGSTTIVDGVITLQVKGVITVGNATERKPTAQLLNKKTLAMLIAKLGAISEPVLKAMEEVWEAQLTGAEIRIDEKSQERCDIAHGKFERIMDRLPKSPVEPSVKVNGTVQIVSPVKEAA